MSRYRGVERFCRFRTPVALMIDRAIGPAPEVKSLKIYDYTPPFFADSFTLPAQDAEGYSILTPSADSRVMYVSTSGNDATGVAYTYGDGSAFTDWFADEGQMAFATPAAAQANMRDGFPDYICLKRGDSFSIASDIRPNSGRSATERTVYTTYGAGARPRVIAPLTTSAILVSRKNHVAIVGWEIYNPKKDPSNPEFAAEGWTWPVAYDGEAILVSTSKGDGICVGVLIEDCKALYFNRLLTTSGNAPLENFIFRKNITGYNYKTSEGATHPQGVGLTVGSYLIEDNIFVNAGWLDKTSDPIATHVKEDQPYGWSGATIYSHSIYYNSAYKTITRNNISSNPSSIHYKHTASSIGRKLDVALTGAAETTIVLQNLEKTDELTFPMSWYVVTDLGAQVSVNVTAATSTSFTIDPVDFSASPASVGNFVMPVNNYIRSYDVITQNEVWIGGEVGLSYGGNSELETPHPRFVRNIAEGLVLSAIGKYQPTGRALAYGLEPIDVANSEIRECLFTPTNNASVTNKFAVQHNLYTDNIKVFNNIAHQSGSIYAAAINGPSFSNAEDIPLTEYVNPDASIENYLISIGETGTLERFNEMLLLQSKGSFDERISNQALSTYFRKAFALKNNFYVITQPTNVTAISGDTTTFTFNVVGNTRLIWEWYKDDVLLAGETGYQYSIATVLADSGSQIKAVAIDDDGNQVISNVVTLTVNPYVAQYFYDVNNETLGATLPSFMRAAANSAAYTTSIVEGTRPDGTTGKLWDLNSTASTGSFAVLFDQIGKQSGDIEILLLSKGTSAAYVMPRPAPRIKEDAAGSAEPQWVQGGIRPNDSAIRIRSRISGSLENNASILYSGGSITWTAEFWYQRVKMTAAGAVSVTIWPFGSTEPASPQLAYTDTSNRLFGEYLGIAGWNIERQYIAFASVGLDGQSAPLAPV